MSVPNMASSQLQPRRSSTEVLPYVMAVAPGPGGLLRGTMMR